MAKIIKFFIRLSGQRWGVACKETNLHTRELPVAAVWLSSQGFSLIFIPRYENFSLSLFFYAEACQPAAAHVKNKERVRAQLL